MVGRLTLDQEVGVRVPAPQLEESPGKSSSQETEGGPDLSPARPRPWAGSGAGKASYSASRKRRDRALVTPRTRCVLAPIDHCSAPLTAEPAVAWSGAARTGRRSSSSRSCCRSCSSSWSGSSSAGSCSTTYITLNNAVRSGARTLALGRGQSGNPCLVAFADAERRAAPTRSLTDGSFTPAPFFSGGETCMTTTGWLQGDNATSDRDVPVRHHHPRHQPLARLQADRIRDGGDRMNRDSDPFVARPCRAGAAVLAAPSLDQEVGVRVPAPQLEESPGNGAFLVAGLCDTAGTPRRGSQVARSRLFRTGPARRSGTQDQTGV